MQDFIEDYVLTKVESNSAQLDNIAPQVSANTTAIANIGNASPKGIYATLAALQAAYPTGTTGIYLVTADGKWYYWSGSAWTVGGTYQSAGIADNSILVNHIGLRQVYGRKTDFMVVDDACNLIDRAKLIANMKVSGGTTGLLTTQSGYYASDFLEIQPNSVYYYGNIYTGYFAFYDVNGAYISGMNTSTAEVKLFTPFTTPSNAYFMRISLNSSAQVPLCWISKTNAVPADFRYKQVNVNLNTEQINAVKALAALTLTENPITVDQTAFISKVGNANPIDRTKIESGYYIKGQSAGEKTATASGLWVTDYCELAPETQYYREGIYGGYYAFYDANKNYISGGGVFVDETTLPNPFTTPIGTVYGRFTLNDDTKLDNCWINILDEMPMDEQYYVLPDTVLLENARNTLASNPCDYMGNEVSVFNKGLCIGDSLTYGVFNLAGGTSTGITKYGYPTILTKLTGIATTNTGLASNDSKQWYAANDAADLSGHDFAIIQLGVNDVAHTAVNVEGGIVNFATESATYLASIVDYIKSQNQKIKIFVSTILPAFSSENYDAMSNIIRAFVAGRTDCYLVDMATYSRARKDTPYENGHLNATGYCKLAEEYKSYISYIIANNLTAFADVQFSNTDLT